MFHLLARLGERSAKHPWRVLVTFILSIVLLGGVAGAVGAGFTNEVRLGNTDSQQATDLLTVNSRKPPVTPQHWFSTSTAMQALLIPRFKLG